jgi:alpha-glucosidase
MKLKQILFLQLVLICLNTSAKDYMFSSPDKKISLKVNVSEVISWSVIMDGKQVVTNSAIALQLEGETLGINPKVVKSILKEINENSQAVVPYKFKNINDQCNELLISFKGDYALRFRAYNNGVAYRIEVNRKGEMVVVDEKCEFNFEKGCSVLFPEEKSFISHHEPLYIDTVLTAIRKDQFCDLPVLIAITDGLKLVVTETGQSDYPAMYLKGTGSNSLIATFPPVPSKIERIKDRFMSENILENSSYVAKTSASRALPWRCILLAREDKELIENNIPYILAERNVLQDVSWIKPGKVAWEWWSACNVYGVDFKSGINTETYKYYIDFASEYGLEYIIMDGRWSDYVNLDKPSPGVNVEEIISYGRKKGVGVILWAHWRPLVTNLEQYLDLFAKWGAVGLKVDFMIRSDQLMVNYYETIAAAAAKRKMLIDFHGAFKPNGLQRKYPNVLNLEGVLGSEHNKWSDLVTPVHNVTIPFIRMVAGPMDYTLGAMKNETAKGFKANNDTPMSQGTRCHQAGMFVVYEAPLQMLCDNATHYLREPEYTRFIAQIPTTWDETIALEGKVKKYIIVARKNGDNWYIGGMNDLTARDFEVDLSFIGGGDWNIEYVADGVNADRYPQDYILKKTKIEGKKLKISMAAGGGYAAILMKYN